MDFWELLHGLFWVSGPGLLAILFKGQSLPPKKSSRKLSPPSLKTKPFKPKTLLSVLFKMRYTGLLSFALLPLVPAVAGFDQNGRTVTIQLANDHSGVNADRCVPADGKKYPVSAFWSNSALSQNGGIFATNGQLIAYPQNAACNIECPHGTLGFNSRTTWLSLANGQQVDMRDAFVTCHENWW
ncbi:uncharacterized protein N7498_010276 [Penicillium cinerascens]|uniref:Uncharacterized protein n=1 Tax=Penicillium cinerascens TaxID=70096 RepID=A0A9W9M688_9EURO|nr:uncharacterized protein N7498_010276 [Penicillium cinerascens]KAJ5191291.1 hypothetical protein N7498_010276 [Penicillium cinerascens]